jgi:signal transduction histidine kinase
LLIYSKTNATERNFEQIDLNKVIDEVKEDLSEELKDKHAIIETTGLCDVKIIPFQFRQLMHNLIGNALKFSVHNIPPYIKIKSEIAKGAKFKNEKLNPKNKYCHITVSDNGIGFEQQYNEKIFEVFQRLHGKNQYNGTGIGLAIVKKIVENHEGIITASSELNKGATFDIYIPVT